MIKYWTNFEKVGDLPDWSGVALTIDHDTRRETVERVLDDPRIQQLAGLKIIGFAWEHGTGQLILEQTGTLPALELLSVAGAEAEEGTLQLQQWLSLFPGLDELLIENCVGGIERCRHLCLRSLMVYNALDTFPQHPEDHPEDGIESPPDLQKLEALCDSVYPALEELSLGFHGIGEGADLNLIERYLPSILQGEAFPNLKLLRFVDLSREDLAVQLVETIVAQTSLAPNLESIIFHQCPGLYGPQEGLRTWQFADRLSIPSWLR